MLILEQGRSSTHSRSCRHLQSGHPVSEQYLLPQPSFIRRLECRNAFIQDARL